MADDDRPTAQTPSEPYTVHADAGRVEGPTGSGTPGGRSRPVRGGPDPVALVAGLVALVVAVIAVLGPGLLDRFDPRWVLAAAAMTVGVVVLLSTVRRRG